MRTTVGCLLLLVMACASNKTARGDAAETATGEVVTADAGVDFARRGMSCPDGLCGEGLQCRRYYGFAGPRGPEMTQCVVPCGVKGQCPDGETCVTISDGPGRVCASANEKTEAPNK